MPHAIKKKIRKLESKNLDHLEKISRLKRSLPLEAVEDYALSGPNGPVKLSELFGTQRDLIVIHNMGASCRYCTLWADGFNGVLPHLESRAAFVVVSPDTPAAQKKFAKSRGWKFRMISGRGSPFAADMGFMSGEDPWPGVSTFVKRGRKVYRVASSPFGPMDPFCAVWHLFGLLAGGMKKWEPQYRY